jgi:hypothetical protein
MADEAAKQLVGSWRLTSWVIQVVGGEATEPFGPNPKGRAVFTPNGYAAFIIVGANRKPATNNDETAALLKSLLVYTGKFTIEETNSRPRSTCLATSSSPGRIR